MDIIESRLAFLRNRHSVRAYSPVSLTDEQIKSIQAEITMINTHEAGIFFTLVTEDSNPFSSIRCSYGLFRGVKNYITAVVDEYYPDALERLGYYGELLVLKAQETGLASCFVGASFDDAKVDVQLRAGRKLEYLIALGIPAEKENMIARISASVIHHKKRETEQFYITSDYDFVGAKKVFPHLQESLDAVACAPSAVNRRPTRLTVKNIDGEHLLVASINAKNRWQWIDFGIAKCNVAYLFSDAIWEWGNNAPLIFPPVSSYE